jgi:4-hydroxybenzoate polyprenyltransferase
MITENMKSVAIFGMAFISSFILAIFLFGVHEQLKGGWYCVAFGALAGVLKESIIKSKNTKRKIINYFLAVLGSLIPAIISGF